MNHLHNNPKNRVPDDWETLQAGYLSGICQQVQVARRSQAMRSKGLGLLFILITVGLGAWGISRVAHPDPGTHAGIPCRVVQENRTAYLAGTLDAEITLQIEAHLDKCKQCRAMLAEFSSSGAGHDLVKLGSFSSIRSHQQRSSHHLVRR